MSFVSQFTSGGIPLGALVQGVDVSLGSSQYIRCDGSSVTRVAQPRLSTLFPFGALTGTVRTLTATPPFPQVVATPTHFVASSSSGFLQYSADGVTWTNISSPPSGNCSGIVVTPTRVIAINTTSVSPYISSSLNMSTATWAASTGGPHSVSSGDLVCRLSYGTTPGRTLAVTPTDIYTLDEGSSTWVSRTATGASRQGACWTGTRFIILDSNTKVLHKSTDGITWSDFNIPLSTASGKGNIASNGSGVVVISGLTTGLLVSSDHGDTWTLVGITGITPSADWIVQYSGRFFISTDVGIAMSIDGKSWFIDRNSGQSFVLSSGVAMKSGVIMQTVSSTTTAYSFSESATNFCLPDYDAYTLSPSGTAISMGKYFMKRI